MGAQSRKRSRPAPAARRSGLRDEFRRSGYLPPRVLADEAALAHFRALDIEIPDIREANDKKCLWQVDPFTFSFATTNKALTNVLDELFDGSGYYFWSAQVLLRTPRLAHGWHTDIETAREGFVTAWIGIDGVCAETSLSVIEGSHRCSGPLQAFWHHEHPARLDPAAEEILRHPELAGVSSPTVAACDSAGEGIFFDGLMWHGSFNTSGNTRRALLLGYGRHGTPVRRTPSYSTYPFVLHPTDNPLTVPVRGQPDPVANKTMVRRPDGRTGYPPARTGARPDMGGSDDRAWRLHPYFSLESPVMSAFECHASVLSPGFMPHTSHTHDEEELLVVLSGGAAVFVTANRTGALRADKAGPGDVFYFPPGVQHTIANLTAGDEPLGYVMLKWTSRSGRKQNANAFKIPARAHRDGKKLSTDQPSSGLDKLHVHSTTLAPGQATERHIDRHDAAVLVLSGELSMLDRTLGPGGVFYSRAGEVHDTRNTRDEPCHYLVFEFHAMAA